MADQRPEFRHRAERRGVVGPFSGRQLLSAFLAVAVAIVVLAVVTTPLGQTASGPTFVDPKSTPFVIGAAPAEGLRVGDEAPDFDVPLPDGTRYQLTDLEGNPVRLEDLRGKAVWLNFFASWCPPCQEELPHLRAVAERHEAAGLVVLGVSVQETSADDVRRYATTYGLRYPIGFDATSAIFKTYRVFALPTQIFLDHEGVVRATYNGPVTEQQVEAILAPLIAAAR